MYGQLRSNSTDERHSTNILQANETPAAEAAGVSTQWHMRRMQLWDRVFLSKVSMHASWGMLVLGRSSPHLHHQTTVCTALPTPPLCSSTLSPHLHNDCVHACCCQLTHQRFQRLQLLIKHLQHQSPEESSTAPGSQ
jgi:hypothetical protein